MRPNGCGRNPFIRLWGVSSKYWTAYRSTVNFVE